MPTHPGVTVAICCHNSATRLPETLKHLLAQESADGISWEVLVIDNASTDHTAEIAARSWPKDGPVPLRVIAEPRPGLSNARVRALHEARYDIVSFIDDDNWVNPDWVQVVHAFFEQHAEMGGLGGCGSPVFEKERAPSWFEKFSRTYAAGPQYDDSGDITDLETSLLWGAGLSIRSQIFLDLEARGFQFMCTDRVGNQLASSGDTELCYAIRALGWRLYYLSTLRYRHFIPETRLSWNYLRNMCRGSGRGSFYINIIRSATTRGLGKIRRSWLFLALKTSRTLWRILMKNPKVFFTVAEGEPLRLQMDAQMAFLSLILQMPCTYGKLYAKTESVFKDRSTLGAAK